MHKFEMSPNAADVISRLTHFPDDVPVVTVPIFNAYDDVVACIRNLLEHTPANVPILAIDDASTDPRISEALRAIADERFIYIRKPTNSGFVSTANLAFEIAKPRDVVLVNSDVIVPARWLERLRAAAYSQTTIATATPFTNHGSLLTLPESDRPSNDLPAGMSLEQIDARVQRASLKLRPAMPTCIGHCVYIKRLALDAVGTFDEAFAPGYGEEVDFSQRCIKAGLSHVVCDDLFVYHRGSRSFSHDPKKETQRRAIQDAHEQLINDRYPWYAPWRQALAAHTDHPLARAHARARAALMGYRIAIDATSVATYTAGTQVLTLELSHAITQWLAANQHHLPCPMHVTIILSDALPATQFNELSKTMNVARMSQVCADHLRFDLIHRPFQVTSARDLTMLNTLGRRCIISQLDCIAYTNPSYMHDAKGWLDYRRTTEAAMAFADGVIYISKEGQLEAERLGLHVPAERARVIHLGVDHRFHLNGFDKPDGTEHLLSMNGIRKPYILVIGTDFHHKNRIFALRVAQALTQRYGWTGSLVLAGPTVSAGSSASVEIAQEAQSPELNGRVIRLGPISEAQKAALIKHAALVLYPSLREGFGIVPFEAALLDTPALTLRISSQQEVLGDHVNYIESLDADAAAATAWQLMKNADAAKAQVQAILAQACRYTWSKTAEATVLFYDHILKLPKRAPGTTAPQTEEIPRERSWFERAQLAMQVLSKEGWPGLHRTINEYLTWRRGQFRP